LELKLALRDLIVYAHVSHVRCKNSPCMLQPERMDKTIRKYTSFDEAKADEYRYWQSRPAQERMAAVSEITQELYAMKGAVPDVPRLQRALVHLKRPQG
jgi:hypothetical protein